MTPGLPKGFKRVLPPRRSSVATIGCPHSNFDQNAICTACGLDLWDNYLRRQIRALEEGQHLPEEKRVWEIVAILTAPLMWQDDFRYVGVSKKLPRHLRPAKAGSAKKSRAIKQAIQAAQTAAERKRTAVHLIETSAGHLVNLGLDEEDMLLLKYEVVVFLDAYMVRFQFSLAEQDLWPLILAYAARLSDVDPDTVVGNYFLDTDAKRQRFRFWHKNVRITDDTLGEPAWKRYER